jgi:hypothetical protein
MSEPRRPDDARLSTADLATAGERADNTAARPTQPAAPSTPARPSADRDVTREAQRAGVVADAAASGPATDHEHPTPLFAGHETDDFRHRWNDIQTAFVDEPRQAVERADALVATAIKRLAEIFAQERSTLEQQWARGADVSTEDLRVALQRYRGFFDRLLSV